MNNKDHAVYRALEGAATFGDSHAATFPAGSQGATDFSRLKPLLQEIGKPQLTPGVPASPATGGKAALIDEVREDLIAIAGTAETIARKEPGFDASFQLGANTQRDTLADAKTFLKNLEDNAVVAKFIAYAMALDFVQDLIDDLAAIDGKKDEQLEDKQDSTGETARTRALIQEGRALLKSLNTSVTNRFRRDPEILAKWQTASHIERSPRKSDDTGNITPPTPPTP